MQSQTDSPGSTGLWGALAGKPDSTQSASWQRSDKVASSPCCLLTPPSFPYFSFLPFYRALLRWLYTSDSSLWQLLPSAGEKVSLRVGGAELCTRKQTLMQTKSSLCLVCYLACGERKIKKAPCTQIFPKQFQLLTGLWNPTVRDSFLCILRISFSRGTFLEQVTPGSSLPGPDMWYWGSPPWMTLEHCWWLCLLD